MPDGPEAHAIDEHEMEAEYTLEYEAMCPFCQREIRTLQVVRLLRSRVNFTSTLPRRGRVMVCPHCKKIISAELAGFA
jgi:glutaredoxin